MTNLSHLGETVAKIMDTIESEDLPEDAEVAEVLVIAAVTWPVPGEPDTMGHSLFWRCTSALPWVQLGLVDRAKQSIEVSGRPYGEEDKDAGES